MKLKETLPNIYHLHFITQKELTSTFLRFQEYYESPKFKNKVFTLKEYKEWYKKASKKDKFTYYSDWSGFNIPSSTLKPFYRGQFNPLSPKETALLDIFQGKDGEFYIIGTYGANKSLKHEIAHGLFYTNNHYKQDILKILSSINKGIRKKINSYLGKSGGYHRESWEDETHTYLLTNTQDLSKLKIPQNTLILLKKQLNKVFKKYS